ncbi:MAG: CAP domain-containing protein [Candidatus Saccharimonadales bacterium]
MKKHTHHLHSVRVILFGVLLIAVALVRVNSHALPRVATNTHPNQAVLAYSSSISRAALLAENNASRAANGLGAMTLNSQLNNSAQAKAQNMADNNYWAHVAPDGTQPWYFFEAAGYSYQGAGENLAYGFDTSFAVNQGWMNSPGHKANILGDYADVGFGFVNAPNFQGGEYTIVVAHYGKPLSYTAPAKPAPTASNTVPAPAPAPVASAPKSNTTPAPTSAPSPATTPVTAPETPAAPSTPAPTESKASKPSENPSTPAPVAVGAAKNVSVFESLSIGSIPPMAAISLGVTLAVGLGYALTHRRLMQHALATSEHFVVAHPTFDALALTLAVALILSSTVARLQ